MGVPISTRIDEELDEILHEIAKEEQVDKSTAIRKVLRLGIHQYKIDKTLKLYREKKLTLWRAASEAGLSLREMIALCVEKQVEFQYSMKDLEEDFQAALEG
ncbi:MAG: UPF0175 family protein [Candidatus Hodarchaeales archaeon]|jgi:predicted HTH domain antitoxin